MSLYSASSFIYLCLYSHLTVLYSGLKLCDCKVWLLIYSSLPPCWHTEPMDMISFWIPQGVEFKNCIVWLKCSNYRVVIDQRFGCVQSFASSDRGVSCWLWMPLVLSLFRDHSVISRSSKGTISNDKNTMKNGQRDEGKVTLICLLCLVCVLFRGFLPPAEYLSALRTGMLSCTEKLSCLEQTYAKAA